MQELEPRTLELAEDRFHRHHHLYHATRMESCLKSRRLREALACTQPGATCEPDICDAERLINLQLDLLARLMVVVYAFKRTPKYLGRSDVKDVLSRLMAVDGLLTNSARTELIVDCIVQSYYPDHVKIFFDTFTRHIHDTHRQKFWKRVRSAMERHLCQHLRRMKEESGSKQKLRELQEIFSYIIQAMATPLHDDTVPAIPDNSGPEYRFDIEHCPLFTRAVRLKLVPEALLLHDTGAVGNKELGVLAKHPDIQKMLQNEEDNSVLTVFLRKVLNKPRSLQSLAAMQVSRLLWCHAPGDKEQRARDLGLLDFQVERVLLRGQCDRYRAALKQADDEDKAEAS